MGRRGYDDDLGDVGLHTLEVGMRVHQHLFRWPKLHSTSMWDWPRH